MLTRRGSVALIAPRGLQKYDGSELTTLDSAALPGSLAYASLYATSAGQPRLAHFN